MKIFVSGSLAYDRIMDFPGRFADHIMPDKLHMINISFAVNGIVERPGGTAGNIAYALKLLDEDPTIVASIGRDYQPYFKWLDDKGLDHSAVHIVEEEATACAHIITDMADNQITAFNPGAMGHPSPLPLENAHSGNSIAIIGPGNLDDMIKYPQLFRRLDIRYIFDPGQSLPLWESKSLANAILGSHILISNDYELALIKEITGLTDDALLRLTDTIITTKGDHGSVIVTDHGETHIPSIPRPDTPRRPHRRRRRLPRRPDQGPCRWPIPRTGLPARHNLRLLRHRSPGHPGIHLHPRGIPPAPINPLSLLTPLPGAGPLTLVY